MIRSVNISHLNEIIHIENMVFKKPWSRKQLENDIYFNKNAENLIYLKKNKIIGYVLGNKIINEYQLNNIAVHKEFQCQHIGTLLMQELIQRLLMQNIHSIILEVSEKNYSAIYLYKSLGFKKKYKRKNYYAKNDHAFVFTLDLKYYG